jgi:hypothetical protein
MTKEELKEKDVTRQHVLEANEETRKHINRVRFLINNFIIALLDRAESHDASKLESPEVEIFARYTPKLKELTYGSEEYKQTLAEMKSALDHHYEVNAHHPEHHEFGIDDMDLVDIIEMLCDWKAASERHADGDVKQSIKINTDRFSMNQQLVNILCNSLGFVDD